MKINDAVIGAILLLLGLVLLVHVQAFPRIPGQQVGPAMFPGLIAAGLAACGVLLIISGLRRRATEPWFAALPWTRSARHIVAVVAVVAACLLYIALADLVGFLLVAPPLLAVLFVIFGERPGRAIVVAVIATLVVWYAFYKLLRVPLPWGLLKNFAF